MERQPTQRHPRPGKPVDVKVRQATCQRTNVAQNTSLWTACGRACPPSRPPIALPDLGCVCLPACLPACVCVYPFFFACLPSVVSAHPGGLAVASLSSAPHGACNRGIDLNRSREAKFPGVHIQRGERYHDHFQKAEPHEDGERAHAEAQREASAHLRAKTRGGGRGETSIENGHLDCLLGWIRERMPGSLFGSWDANIIQNEAVNCSGELSKICSDANLQSLDRRFLLGVCACVGGGLR